MGNKFDISDNLSECLAYVPGAKRIKKTKFIFFLCLLDSNELQKKSS